MAQIDYVVQASHVRCTHKEWYDFQDTINKLDVHHFVGIFDHRENLDKMIQEHILDMTDMKDRCESDDDYIEHLNILRSVFLIPIEMLKLQGLIVFYYEEER